jgi:hypothetical protein
MSGLLSPIPQANQNEPIWSRKHFDNLHTRRYIEIVLRCREQSRRV